MFFQNCEKIINNQPGWKIERKTFLSTFTYLKINIYKDLSKNEDVVCSNPFVNALAGDFSSLPNTESIFKEVVNIDLDKDLNPQETFQILDADSSQQRAIELAKRGVSFVLQGPPGTGKSQTIANIIAECLANDKKILFVSEKEAALNVVKNRLSQVNIMDFCLALHSHKANKKEIISDLYKTACIRKFEINENEISNLQKLYDNRNRLDAISKEIHKRIGLLGKSLYEVNGELAALETSKDIIFDCDNIESIDYALFNKQQEIISLLMNLIKEFKGDRFSPLWGNCILSDLSQQNKMDFKAHITPVVMQSFSNIINDLQQLLGDVNVTWLELDTIVELLVLCSTSEPIPPSWLKVDLEQLLELAQSWEERKNNVAKDFSILQTNFNANIIDYNARALKNYIEDLNTCITQHTHISPIFLEDEKFFHSFANIKTQVNTVNSYLTKFFIIEENCKDLSLNIGDFYLSDLSKLTILVKDISSLRQINSSWFESNATLRMKILLENTKHILLTINEQKEFINSCFDISIYDIDAEHILRRFRTEYNTIFRVFKASYRKDLNLIKGCKKLRFIRHFE